MKGITVSTLLSAVWDSVIILAFGNAALPEVGISKRRKNHVYRGLIFLGALLLVLVQPVWFPQASFATGENNRCMQIRAKEHAVRVTEGCTSPVDFCVEGVITGDGLIQGKTSATILGLAPSVGLPGIEPETTVSVAGERTIMTSHGTLTLRFTAVFDTARGEFSELLRVTAGTGKFREATGTLYLTGRLSADGTSIEADITGFICRAGLAKEQ